MLKQKKERLSADRTVLTLLLDRNQMDTLDGLAAHLGVSRQEILTRGMFVLDVTHMLVASSPSATVTVQVFEPPN